jgi:regulator of ribosome biosynthesis
MVLDTQELVAQVMGSDDEGSSDEEVSKEKSAGLRHLSITDPSPMDEAAFAEAKASQDGLERFLHRAASDATEALVHALWKLPTERTAQGPVATLPNVTKGLVLPREKPLPEPKPETRWEKFAKEKGIEKKKRGRMVWDDVDQKWAPRFGYQRAYDEGEEPIKEVKVGEDPYADPWEKARVDKKARVAKNNLQRVKNDERAGGGGKTADAHAARVESMKAGLPVDLSHAKGNGLGGAGAQMKSQKAAAMAAAASGSGDPGAPKPAHKGKAGLATALTLAQQSTASMGKFDTKRFGEPTQLKQAHSRAAKPANDTTPKGLASEKERNAKLLGRVLLASDRGVKPAFKGAKGERIEARKRSREFHPLDDAPYENLGGGEAGTFKKKKGRAGAGKMTKMTKKRIK